MRAAITTMAIPIPTPAPAPADRPEDFVDLFPFDAAAVFDVAEDDGEDVMGEPVAEADAEAGEEEEVEETFEKLAEVQRRRR
jgi:hypothetical protein